MSLFGERACLAMPANVEQPRRDDKSATPCEHGYMASCKLLAVHTFRNDALPWVHREKQRLYLMIFSPLISHSGGSDCQMISKMGLLEEGVDLLL